MRSHPTHQSGSICIVLAVWLMGIVAPSLLRAEPIAIADVKRAEPLDFGKDVLPILRKNCIACHNAKDREGELVLEAPALMRKGGETGPAIVDGKGAESLIVKVAARLEKPYMPPKNNKVGANPLTPEQLGLLKRWIDQGAKGDGAPTNVGPIEWHPLPEGLNPIYAVAVTDDAQLAACNRANQVFVYSLPRRQLFTRLTDPALLDTVAHGRPGIAHRDLVQSLAFSPDGRLLASGGYREIKIWQRPDPAIRFTLPAMGNQRIGSLATSPDGKTLVVGGDDGVIHLFNLPDGKPRAELKGHSGQVTSLRFSADGTRMFSASADKSIRVWNAADGSFIARVDAPQPLSSILALEPKNAPAHLVSAGGDNSVRTWAMPEPARMIASDFPGPASALAASADRKRIAIAGADNALRIIDVESGKAGNALAAHSTPIRAIGFSGDGKTVLAASDDGAVNISSVDDAKTIASLFAHGPLTAAAIRPDARQAAIASGDGRASLWRLDAPAPRAIGEADQAAATAFAISPDNKLIATATMLNGKPTVIVRNIISGETVQKLPGAEGNINAVSFSPDSARLIAGGVDRVARVWTIAEGKEVARFAGHIASITAVAVLPDNARAISAATDGSMKAWTISDAKEVRSLPSAKGAIIGVGVLPNDQLVAASSDQTLAVFDLNSAAPIRATILPAAPTSLAVARDGRRFAVACADSQIRVINSADGVIQQVLPAAGPATLLSFSADGKRLAASAETLATVFTIEDAIAVESLRGVARTVFAEKPDEVITVGDDKIARATPLRFLLALPGITKKINRLLYNNDGSLVIAGSDDGTIRAFGSADGVAKFAATHGAGVRDLALSPDGATIASGGDDKLVKLWNAATGAPAVKPQIGPLGERVTSLAFSSDSKRLIAATSQAAELTIFDCSQAAALETYASHSQGVVALAALKGPDGGGDAIFTACADKSLRIVRTSLRSQLQAHTDVVTSLAAVPNDASRFLSGSADGTIRQWNLTSANPERQFVHGAPVRDLAMRSDGKMFASAGGNSAKLFDFAGGKETATLKGDRLLTDRAQLAERQLGYEQAQMNLAKQQADAAAAQQTADTQAVAKSVEAKTAAEKSLAEKQTALAARQTAKSAADKTVAEAIAAIASATQLQATTDKQLADAKAAANAGGEKVTQLTASSQKLSNDAQALVQAAAPLKAKSDASSATASIKSKAAADAKAASDTTATALASAEKTAVDAKAAAEKEPGNAALQEAAKVAAKVVTDAAAAAKAAADALAAAQKASDEAAQAAATDAQALVMPQRSADDKLAAVKLSTMLLESAQKLAAERTTHVQKTTEAKAAADAALAAAKAKQSDAENKAKTAASEAAQAEKDFGIAQINLASADQAVTASKEGLARSDKELADRKAAHALATAQSASAQVELDNARKTATQGEGPVNVVAFSHDGATVYTAGDPDGAVRTFSSDSGIACEILRGHNGAVSALATSPDGSVFSGSVDRTVKSFDINPPWTLKATLGTGDEHSPLVDRVLSLAFSPDGTLLASGGGVPSRSGELKLWSVATGQLFREFPEAHSDTVYGLSFSGDGKLLASGAADKFARVWNVQTGALVRSFEGHTHHVLDVSLRHDGRTLATVGADNTVKLWDVTTGAQRASSAQFSKFEVTSVAHVGFGDRFLVTTGEGHVRLVREDLGIERAFDVAGGASNFIYAGAATPDGTSILSGGYDSILRVRDARDGKVLADLGPPK